MTKIKCPHCGGEIDGQWVAKQYGTMGGKQTAKRGSEYYKKISKKGLEKRWGKKKTMGGK